MIGIWDTIIWSWMIYLVLRSTCKIFDITLSDDERYNIQDSSCFTSDLVCVLFYYLGRQPVNLIWFELKSAPKWILYLCVFFYLICISYMSLLSSVLFVSYLRICCYDSLCMCKSTSWTFLLLACLFKSSAKWCIYCTVDL